MRQPSLGGELGGPLLLGELVPGRSHRRTPGLQSLGLRRTLVQRQGAEFPEYSADVTGFRELDQCHRAVSARVAFVAAAVRDPLMGRACGVAERKYV